MKKNYTYKKLLLTLFLAILGFVCVPTEVSAQVRSSANTGANIEFDARPSGSRRFRITFYNSSEATVQIRIYDMIGNLVKEELVSVKGKFVKEYDMSKNKSEVFIIEVGNTKYSNTKRVYVQ